MEIPRTVAKWRTLCAAAQMFVLADENLVEQAHMAVAGASTHYAGHPMIPEVVCLCGSTRHLAAFLDWQRILTMNGSVVVTIGCVLSGKDSDQAEAGVLLDELHKRKIDLADMVLILDIGGYMGSSTTSECEYALSQEKTVVRVSEAYPEYECPDLEAVLKRTFSIRASVTYDEDEGCHMPSLEVVRG